MIRGDERGAGDVVPNTVRVRSASASGGVAWSVCLFSRTRRRSSRASEAEMEDKIRKAAPDSDVWRTLRAAAPFTIYEIDLEESRDALRFYCTKKPLQHFTMWAY